MLRTSYLEFVQFHGKFQLGLPTILNRGPIFIDKLIKLPFNRQVCLKRAISSIVLMRSIIGSSTMFCGVIIVSRITEEDSQNRKWYQYPRRSVLRISRSVCYAANCLCSDVLRSSTFRMKVWCDVAISFWQTNMHLK